MVAIGSYFVATFRMVFGLAFAACPALALALIRCKSPGSRSRLREVCHLQ